MPFPPNPEHDDEHIEESRHYRFDINTPGWHLTGQAATHRHFNNHRIINLGAPINGTDAANRNYVDELVADLDATLDDRYVSTAGDTVTGTLHITNPATGVAILDIDGEQDAVVHFRARDNAGSGGWGVVADATGATGRTPGLHIAFFDDNELYIRSPLVFSYTGVQASTIFVHPQTPLDLGNATLRSVGTPQEPTDAANRFYVDNAITTGNFVRKAGDTMTGSLAISGINNGVLLSAQSGILQRTGGLTLLTDVLGQGAFIEGQGGTNRSQIMTHATGVLKAGDTMSGNLSLGTNAITNLRTPTANDPDHFAATKEYVDTKTAPVFHFIGVYTPRNNTPDLISRVNDVGDAFLVQTLNPQIPELVPIGVPGVGGTFVDNNDFLVFSAGNIFVRVHGVGLDLDTADARYLRQIGGAVTGTIQFSNLNNGITWTNITAQGAVYSDAQGNLILRRGGGNNSINQPELITENSGGANREFLLTRTAGVLKAGDTMTGPLTLNVATPVADLHAASKLYVDGRLTQTQADQRYVIRLGDTMSGGLGFGSRATIDGRDVSAHITIWRGVSDTTSFGIGYNTQNLNIVAAAAATSQIQLFAGTGATSIASVSNTGLHLNIGPTATNHVTTKAYVDTADAANAAAANARVLKAGDTMTGALTVQGQDLVTHLNSTTTGARATLAWGIPGSDHFQLFRNNGATSLELDRVADNGTPFPIFNITRTTGNVTWTSTNTYNAVNAHNTGINFGSVTASGPTNLTRHIALWGGGTPAAPGLGFGFSVTAGTLNYCVNAVSNMHDFYAGANLVMRLSDTELAMQGARDVRARDFVSNADNRGFATFAGGWFYKKSGTGIVIRQSNGNQQPQIENFDGSNARAILDVNNGVRKAGDTMTGDLTLNATNVGLNFGSGGASSSWGRIYAFSDKPIRITRDSQNRQPQIADNNGNNPFNILDANDTTRVRRNGDSMTGDLNMQGNFVLNVADPVTDLGAANRRFVLANALASSGPWQDLTVTGGFNATRLRCRWVYSSGVFGSVEIEGRVNSPVGYTGGYTTIATLPVGLRPTANNIQFTISLYNNTQPTGYGVGRLVIAQNSGAIAVQPVLFQGATPVTGNIDFYISGISAPLT